MNDANKIRLHVVAIFGKVFPGFPLAPADIAEAISGNAMVVPCPWREEQEAAPDYWELIDNQHDARSFGREIAISTGWQSEPVIPLVMSRPDGQTALTAQRLAQAINMVAASSESWGAPVSVCIHSITIGAPIPQQAHLLADIAAQTGASLGGEIASVSSYGLETAIRCNLWLCRIAAIVTELLQEEGFSACHDDAVDQAVARIIGRFRLNGFDIAMDEAHLNRDFARKMAASILREGYWEI